MTSAASRSSDATNAGMLSTIVGCCSTPLSASLLRRGAALRQADRRERTPGRVAGRSADHFQRLSVSASTTTFMAATLGSPIDAMPNGTGQVGEQATWTPPFVATRTSAVDQQHPQVQGRAPPQPWTARCRWSRTAR